MSIRTPHDEQPTPGPAGEVWGGYRIGRRLGAGGMGFVYEAVRLDDGAEVALKVLRPGCPIDERLVRRFRNEPGFAARLAIPGVVRIVEAGQLPNGGYFFAMERLSGGSLESRLPGLRGCYGPAARLTASVTRALVAIHACGVVHRDLKPGNLLFRAGSGGPEDVVVTDFGVARSLLEQLAFTATGEFVGTAAYAAPEQLAEAGAADERADVFSVGAILFRILTGRHAVRNYLGYPNKEYVEARRTCPPANLVQAAALAGMPEPPWDLVYVCRRCLEPDPRDRFPTAGAVADALEQYLTR